LSPIYEIGFKPISYRPIASMMRSAFTALACLVVGANAITPRERAQEIVANMTTDEKVRLLLNSADPGGSSVSHPIHTRF